MPTNDQYHDIGSNRADLWKWIASLGVLVAIVALFLAFGNLKNDNEKTLLSPKKEVVPQSVTTNNYNTINKYYYKKHSNNYQRNDSDEKAVYLKKIAENTEKTNEKIDGLRTDMSNLKVEVTGIRSDMNAGMASIRSDMNTGFFQNHQDLIVLNGTVKSLADLGPQKNNLKNQKKGYWDGNGRDRKRDSSNPDGWKQ